MLHQQKLSLLFFLFHLVSKMIHHIVSFIKAFLVPYFSFMIYQGTFLISLIMSRKSLPNIAKPKRYELLLDTNTTTNIFTGFVSIEVDILERTNKMSINSKGLNILEVQAIKNSNDVLLNSYTINEEEQTIDIAFESALEKNSNIVLNILYSGTISNNMNGYYISSGEDPVYSTHFEPTSARTAFPCFDQPDMKANFKIMLLLPQNLVGLSNCEVIEERIISNKHDKSDKGVGDELVDGKRVGDPGNNDDVKRHKADTKLNDLYDKVIKNSVNDRLLIFRDSPVMSTYLVSWVIGDLSFIERVSKYPPYIKLRVYGNKKEVKNGEYALNVAHDCINFYQNYFGIEYPLSKVDMVGIPEFAMGAMENWGLITYRKSSLYYNAEESSLNTKKTIADTVCHELAHQWFGNLATMKWWNDLWLNEGFATWASALAMSNLNSSLVDWDVWTSFIASDVEYGMGYDSLHSTHAIQVEVNDPDDIDQIFDGISYSKGSALIRMLEDYLTPEIFKEGLSNYLKRFAYENAETKDLWEELGKVGNKNVKEMMDFWVTKKGFPIIFVRESEAGLEVRQERFFYIKDYTESSSTAESDAVDQSWFVALKVQFMSAEERTGDIKDSNPKTEGVNNSVLVEMNSFDTKIKKITDIYKFNNEGTGFYRVLYENENNLENLLSFKFLSSKNKLNIINDLFQTSIGSYISYKIPLKASEYFKSENNCDVMQSILSGLSEIKGIFYNDNERNELKENILALVKDRISQIDLSTGGNRECNKNSDDKADRKHKAGDASNNMATSTTNSFGANLITLNATLISAAVMNDHKETLELLCKKYSEFEKDKKCINPSFRKSMYVALVKSSIDGIFEKLWEQYKKESADDVKNQILMSLGSSNNKNDIEFLFNAFLGNEIKLQDKIYVIVGLVSNLDIRNLVFDFMLEKYEDVKNMFGENKSLFTSVIERVFSCISDSKRRNELKKVFEKYGVKGFERAAQKSLERSAIKIRFRENNLNKSK